MLTRHGDLTYSLDGNVVTTVDCVKYTRIPVHSYSSFCPYVSLASRYPRVTQTFLSGRFPSYICLPPVFTAQCTLVHLRGLGIACRPSVRLSVRPSVTLVICDHIGWKS